MHARPSHSALDELLDLPSALDAHSFVHGANQASDDVGAEHDLDPTGIWAGLTPSARLPAALWLPAPGSDCASKQRLQQAAALRQRDWPTSTSGVAWVGEASGANVCYTATGVSEDRSQCCAAAPPTVAAAQGRRSKAAGRPCYQTIMKVCFAGQHWPEGSLLSLCWHFPSCRVYAAGWQCAHRLHPGAWCHVTFEACRRGRRVSWTDGALSGTAQTILRSQDKIADFDARAADMQARMDLLRKSNAALQQRNDELVCCLTSYC